MAHVLTLPAFAEIKADSKLAEACRELGLARQAERHASACSVERDFLPMSADERMVWERFCPTAYRSWQEREFATYSYDTIPAEVVEHWARIKRNYAFEGFAIRTTERVADPILIGYFGGMAYLLARWGLESPEAMPLREVAIRVKREYETEHWKYRAWKLFWLIPMRPYLDSEVWQAANRLAR